nr:reverse transcriptase domain-containing protein [Tanacetum cinerariifolium]
MNLLQLVQANSYHGFERENPYTHINNFKRIASTLKFKDVPNDEDLVNKFVNQFSLPLKTTHLKNEISRFTQRFKKTFGEAWERFKEMLRACPHYRFTELAQIDTFYNGLNDNDQDSLNAEAGGNLLSKNTREALQIIENKSKVCYSRNKLNVSRMNTILGKILKVVTPAPVKAVEESCVTCGGAHAYYNCPNTNSNQPRVCVATGTYNQVAPQNRASNNMAPPGFAPVQNSQNRFNQNQGQGNNFNQGNNFHVQQGFSNEFLSYKKANDQMMRNMQNQINSLKGEFKNEIQNTMKTQQTVLMEQLNDFQNNLQNMLSGFFQNQASTSGTLPSNTIPNPKGEMKAITTRSGVAYEGPSIPTPKKIFQDLHFDISFANALLLMPKFASTIKSLLTNKDKLFELVKISLNENFSAILLKKLPEKLGEPGKFLIPCDFSRIDVYHTLADLGASINLMPLSIWKKLSRPELTPTRMNLELADRSITLVDFEADPRVPLLLGRSFLRTGHALIDVYGEEITLRVNDVAVTFNLNQTTRYSSTYDDLSVNRIDIIDVAMKDYAQEILGFSNNSSGGNPASTSKPILFDSSPSLTPFEGSDFILEEIEAYLKDESISPEINHADCDLEGDICLIEIFLNDDPFQLPLMELKQGEVVKAKSLIKEPPELELKDLPSHLEYAYLEGVDKAIAWKITDIKGIDPRFYTHKILMEEDYKPAMQSQRRVNPKVHEVIKKEVIKLLDARMIYPIFDSPWVSPIHCVPKKGGITVVKNKNDELIPTWLVTGWRVCIDYRNLNDATHKDHSPLPFMDQMLERLAGNEFYCFLDRFSGYFQIPINPPDQKNTTFTCPYGTFAYRIMPFGLCNAPRTFQRCMMEIFHDMNKKTVEVFIDDFLVFGDSFSSCLSHLDTMLQWCEDTNLVLNWEKCHFMVKEGIVLGHKISKNRLDVDRAKVNVIAKLPHPTTMKGVRSFLGHAEAYRSFDLSYPQLEPSIRTYALKCLLIKQDAKSRLIRWVLLLQEFDIIIRDKKGTENLAANHLSRLENPHKDGFENKDINGNFPLEILGKISSRSTPWFANFTNFHARNFIVKGMSSQQKKKFFKDIKHYFWDDPYLFGYVRFKSFDGVCMDKKLMISSKPVMKDPPGAIMVSISVPRNYLMPVSFGQPFIRKLTT